MRTRRGARFTSNFEHKFRVNLAEIPEKYFENTPSCYRSEAAILLDAPSTFYSTVSLYLRTVSVFVARMFYMRTPFHVWCRHLFDLNATQVSLLQTGVSKDAKLWFLRYSVWTVFTLFLITFVL